MIATGATDLIAFDGDDIRLVLRDHGSDICLLTYTPRPVNRERLQKGFAKTFADNRAISGAYLISKRAHWWQSPELAQVEARVRAWPVFRDASHRLAYGGSMGGFGVLLSAARTGCERALVSSPQTTFDPAYVTYPNRYAADIAGLDFAEPHAWTGIDNSCDYLVVYDPLDSFDRRQVALVASHPAVTCLPVALASHSPLKLLNQAGVLQGMILDLARGCFDLAATRRRLHRDKRRCSLYYATLAAKAKETRRMTLALWSAQQAFTLEPNALLVFRTLAKLLRDNRDYDELTRTCRAFLAAGGEARAGKDQLRASLFAAKDFEAALELACELAADADATIDDRRWVLRILRALGRNEDAMAAAHYLTTEPDAGIEDHLRLVHILRQCRGHDAAMDALQAAQARFPGDVAVDIAWFDLLFAGRDYDDARVIANAILEREDVPAAERTRIDGLINHPRLTSVQRRKQQQMRTELYRDGKYDEALAVAKEIAAQKDAEDGDIAFVATLLHRLKRYDEGVDVARAGLDVSPGEPYLAMALFENLYAASRFTEAQMIGEDILADCETRDADHERVERLIRNPRLLATIERDNLKLRKIRFADRDFAGALEPARFLARRDTANADDQAYVVRILHQLGRHAEAVAAAKSGLARHGDDRALKMALVDSLFAAGDYAETRMLLSELLARPDLAPNEQARLERMAGHHRLATRA